MRPVTECWTGKNSTKCILARQRDVTIECVNLLYVAEPYGISQIDCGARQPEERISQQPP